MIPRKIIECIGLVFSMFQLALAGLLVEIGIFLVAVGTSLARWRHAVGSNPLRRYLAELNRPRAEREFSRPGGGN